MWFFNKNKKNRKYSDAAIRENERAISQMAGLVSVIIVGVDNPELKKKLRKIQDKIRFFNPTVDAEALALDKTILQHIGTMEREVSKPKSEIKEEEIEELIRRIELLIPKRMTKAETVPGVK